MSNTNLTIVFLIIFFCINLNSFQYFLLEILMFLEYNK